VNRTQTLLDSCAIPTRTATAAGRSRSGLVGSLARGSSRKPPIFTSCVLAGPLLAVTSVVGQEISLDWVTTSSGGGTSGSGAAWFALHDIWLLRLAETWGDFNYPGLPLSPETGAFISPFNTLAEGVTAAPAGSMSNIKAGMGQELITIPKPLTLRAPLASVTLSAP